MCDRYRSFVIHKDSLTVYMNPYCALCNNISIEELSLECSYSTFSNFITHPTLNLKKFPSFTIPLDKSDGDKNSCAEYENYLSI